jgi:hypothetical protein
MFLALKVKAAVDKEVRQRVWFCRCGAQEYFARSLGKRERKHVRYVVCMFALARYLEHFGRLEQRDRKFVLGAERGFFDSCK